MDYHPAGSPESRAFFAAERQRQCLARAAPQLLAACKALVAEQAYYAEHAWEPERMPGNEFYSDKFMVVVRQARDAIAAAEEGG